MSTSIGVAINSPLLAAKFSVARQNTSADAGSETVMRSRYAPGHAADDAARHEAVANSTTSCGGATVAAPTSTISLTPNTARAVLRGGDDELARSSTQPHTSAGHHPSG
jgi:hypothetical protein